MSWRDLLGHEEIVERFRLAVERDRLASTFLFVGPRGVGKRTFALRLAETLLCERAVDFSSCGECPSCTQVRANTHPDVIQVSKPEGKSVIPLELLIGDRESRMREGLCHQIALTPYSGKRKIAILDDADHLGIEGANCLLKTLEEPPSRSILILIGTSVQRQLPTILSRCQVIHFGRLAESQVADLLRKHELVESEQVDRLASLSDGCLSTAMEISDEQLQVFRRRLVDDLAKPHFNAVELARDVAKFVEEAGKDAAKKRGRLRQLATFAAEFYRGLMLKLSSAEVSPSSELQPAIEAAAKTWRHDREAAGLCADRCLETLEHIDASGNMATMIESWLDDLYRLSQPVRA